MKKVSVIVPVYNVEKYLDRCLNSLVCQSLDDIEILVVNDGSLDGSQTIIDDFYNRFPNKVVPLKKDNGGLSEARNYGLDRAKGAFIGFVDGDDYVSETMFEDMYCLAEKYQAEMVICNLQKVNESGKVTQKLPQIPNMPEKIELAAHFSVFSDLSYFACNKLFRRELFENKRFKIGVHFEDIQLIPQLLLECKTLAQTQNYHYQYLERSDSITKTHTSKGLDILLAVEDVERFFAQSVYKYRREELKNFQILEGIYTFLAYLAFVKDERVYWEMSSALKLFIKNRKIFLIDILKYRRFDGNYLLSLPLKKRIFYLLYFFGMEKILRLLVR